MKKFLMLIASIVMIFSMATFSYADDYATNLISAQTSEIRVQNDGKYIDFEDVNPQIINDRTMVPFRKIFNSLGVTDENIKWTPETKTINAKKDNIEIELQIDNKVAKKIVSGETTTIELDSAPVIKNDRTLVPVRFIAESMDRKVSWDADNRVVIIADVKSMLADLRKSIPKYFELVDAQNGTANTYNVAMKATGKIDYKDSEEKSNNTNLNFTLNLTGAKGNDAISSDATLKVTGKGSLYELVEEIKLTDLDVKVIMTKDKIYVYCPALIGDTKGKWVAINLDAETLKEYSTLLEVAETPNMSLEKYFDELEFDADTYVVLENTFNFLKKVLCDENISITGTTTKKYTIKMDLLKALKECFTSEEVETLSFENCTASISGTIENGCNIKSEIKLDLKIAEDTETITIGLDGNTKLTKVNESISVKIPESNETIEAK